MEDVVTKEDLRQFRMLLISDFRQLLQSESSSDKVPVGDLGWLKSSRVRRLLDMSPGTLQNLRIEGNVRYKKVLGSYYYNKADLDNLFNKKH